MEEPPKKKGKASGPGFYDTYGPLLLEVAEQGAQELFNHLHPGGDVPKFIQDASDTPPSLVFTFLDIGQGNATLVECPGGELILIDCGSVSSDKEQIVTNAKEFIQSKGKPIDFLVISHPDKDHINEVHNVVDTLKVGTILVGGDQAQWKTDANNPKSGQEKKKFKEFAEKASGKSFEELLVGGGKAFSEAPDLAATSRLIQCKGGLDVWIIAANAPNTSVPEIRTSVNPTGVDAIKPGTKANTGCIVVMFRYKKTQVLICGDATFSTETYITDGAWKGKLACYALEGGHHGSADSFSDGFLTAVNPSWIHFSADNKGTFRHPTWEMISRVLQNCPLVLTERSFGPHGIVAGPKEKLLGKNLEYIKLSPRIGQVLEVMKTKKVKGKAALDECYQAWKKDLEGTFGKKAEETPDVEIWMSDILFWGRKEKKLEQLLTYWAGWFDLFASEFDRVEKLVFTSEDYYWEWLLTDFNLFTSLVTANLGVYWQLTVDGYGEAVTQRLGVDFDAV